VASPPPSTSRVAGSQAVDAGRVGPAARVAEVVAAGGTDERDSLSASTERGSGGPLPRFRTSARVSKTAGELQGP